MPIFCKGRLALKTASGTVGAGVKVFTISNSSNPLAVGDPIFISKSDFTIPQYLGLATAATTTTLTTTMTTAAAKGTGALLWKPETTCTFLYGPGAKQRRSTATGVTLKFSRGGVALPTRVGDAIEQLTLTWAGVPYGEFMRFRDFIIDEMSAGLDEFTAAWWDYFSEQAQCAKVLAAMDALDGTGESKVTEAFGVSLTITGWDEYVG